MIAKLTIAAVLVIALYSWTAFTSESAPLSRVDPYNRLAQAFEHGHLALDVRPDPGLLALPDPYDPRQNAFYRHPDPRYTHDLSLHGGRFYAYWGPSPVLVLFLPARLLGAEYVPLSVAVLIFALVAFGAAATLLVLLTRRHLPATPDWMLSAGVVAVGLGNGTLFNLRRPAAYEVSITAGLAFACVGLLLLAPGLWGRRGRYWLLAGASLSLGLALGARPPLAILGIALAAALVWSMRAFGAREHRLTTGAALLAPFAACAGLYLAYNQARFGGPFQFGVRYQLTDGVLGVHGVQRPDVGGYFRPIRLLPAVWSYLLAPVRATLQFPFFGLRPPSSDVLGVGASVAEPTAGLLWSAPVVVALGLAPWALRRAATSSRVAIAASAAAGLGVFALVSVLVGRLTERYVADFATYLLVAAVLCWFAVRRTLGRRPRRVADTVGALLVGWTVVVSAALSVTGADARLQTLHPGTFASLERFFSPLPTAVAGIAGNPVLASASSDSVVAPAHVHGLGIAGATVYAGPDTPVELRIVSGSRRLAVVSATMSRGAAIPADVDVSVEPFGQSGPVPVGVDGVRQKLPVLLRAGINRIQLRVLASRPYFTQTDPPRAAQVQLQDVRVDGR